MTLRSNLIHFFFQIQDKRVAVINNRSETPILAAERKIFKEQHGNINRTVYVPDRIKRKSTYKGDFVDYKKQSKTHKGAKEKTKPKRQQSPHKAVGGHKGGKELNFSPQPKKKRNLFYPLQNFNTF